MTVAERWVPRPGGRIGDVTAEAWSGVRGRPARTLMSTLGVAVGMATLVALLGIGAESRAQLLDQIHALGTNLLSVAPGQTLFGQQVQLTPQAVPMVRRIPGVQAVAGLGAVPGATVRRTDRVDPRDTGGIAVYAAAPELLPTVRGEVVRGAFLNAATGRYAVTVLGWVAARNLGIDRPGARVWLGGHWFTVIGVLGPTPLAPDVERAALVGGPAAQRLLGFDGRPTKLYERSADEQVGRVLRVLGATAAPGHPEQVVVSRPSDALAAALAAKSTLSGLLVGLGAVALLVGGLGVATTMTVSVLQRTGELGLRRALGATRGQVRLQIVAESVLIGLTGGALGSVAGCALTAVLGAVQGWAVLVPYDAGALALGASAVIGAVAGLYPAHRAASLPPSRVLVGDAAGI